MFCGRPISGGAGGMNHLEKFFGLALGEARSS